MHDRPEQWPNRRQCRGLESVRGRWAVGGRDGSHLTAALIAQKLRDFGIDCEIVRPVPIDAAVVRRDRVVIVLAVASLTALAWG